MPQFRLFPFLGRRLSILFHWALCAFFQESFIPSAHGYPDWKWQRSVCRTYYTHAWIVSPLSGIRHPGLSVCPKDFGQSPVSPCIPYELSDCLPVLRILHSPLLLPLPCLDKIYYNTADFTSFVYTSCPIIFSIHWLSCPNFGGVIQR